MAEGFNGSAIANEQFDTFSRTLDSLNTNLETPESVLAIRKDFKEQEYKKQALQKAQQLVYGDYQGDTRFALGAPIEYESNKKSLVGKNYNTDELYSTLSTGEQVKNFETYTPGIDNKEAFAQSQTSWDKWQNGATKALAQFGTGIVGGTVGIVYGIGNGIKEGSFSATYDNDFMNYLDTFNERLKYSLPNYKKKSELDDSFGEKLGTVNFWADDFLGGLSFTASAIASEGIWAWATGGTSLATTGARLGARIGRIGAEAGRLTSYSDDAVKIASKAKTAVVKPLADATRNSLMGLKTANIGGRLGQGANIVRSMYTGAGYESGFEARSYMREMREKFEDDWIAQHGTSPSDEDRAEFDKNLESTANGLFAYNLAIVGSSNLATFGSLSGIKLPSVFQGTQKYLNKKMFGSGTTIVDDAVEAVKATNIQKIGQYGYSLVKGAIVEGAWEEGMQSVGNNTAKNIMQDGYDQKFANETYSISKAFGKGFSDTYGSKEGLEEIYVGMLIGAFTGNALGVYQNKTLNHEFKNSDLRAKSIEENFGKNSTYSTKVAVENMVMNNRVIASKKAEENATKRGDFLGGQIARNNTMFAQFTRANNLAYFDQTVDSSLKEIDLIDEGTLMQEHGLTLEQAQELKENMKQEYQQQSDTFKRVNEFSNYFVGNKINKQEKEEIEKHLENKGYSKEEAKKVSVDVLREALSYELYMGEVSYNHADEMLLAFQNSVQNVLGSSKIKNAFTITDILKKSAVTTQRKANQTKKDLQKATLEFDNIEKKYREVENVIAKTASVEERQRITGQLSDLLLQKEELAKRKQQLTEEFNVVINSAKLEDPFSKNASESYIPAEEILGIEKEINLVLEKIETYKNTDPQKAEAMTKLLREYEKSIGAFKTYSERTTQMMSGVGLKGKRNIITQLFVNSKTPKQATIDMIKGLMDTHYEVDNLNKQEEIEQKLDREAKEVKKQQLGVVMTEAIPVVEKRSVKEFITDQIKNHPYLFDQIGEDYAEAVPTEEEVSTYYDLFEKDLIEESPLSEEEKTRFEQLNTKMANWQLIETIENGGVTIAEMVQQELVGAKDVNEVRDEEFNEEDVEQIIKNGEVEADSPRPLSILQTIQNVFVRKYNSGYYISHLTPKGFFEFLGETGELTYHKVDNDGKIIEKSKKASIGNINDVSSPGTVISFGNTSISIESGMRIKVKPMDFESMGFKTRDTKSGFMIVFDSEGNAMKSDFSDTDVYSPKEIYNLKSGDKLIAKVDRNDPYNQKLKEVDLEKNLKISLYDEAGNKVADLKAEHDTDTPDSQYLNIRIKAYEKYKNSDDDLIEVGDIEVETIFLGSPNLKLDENNKEKQFLLEPSQVYDYGIWQDGKTKLKGGLKGVRVDLLKGINKTLPIIVVKEGDTLIAYPVTINKVDSMMGDELLSRELSLPQLVIQLNQLLIASGKRPSNIYYMSEDNQNIFDENGQNSEIFQGVINKANSIKNTVDFKKEWFSEEHTKDMLKEEATVNLNLEFEKFLSPKIAISLESFNEYSEDGVTTDEEVTQIVVNYLEAKKALKVVKVKFSGDRTLYRKGSDYFYVESNPFGEDYITFKATDTGYSAEHKKWLENPTQDNLQLLLKKVVYVKVQKLPIKDIENVVAMESQIENDNRLKRKLNQILDLNSIMQEQADENKKC